MVRSRILLVEDDAMLARTLVELLQRSDYEVALAKQGREAIERLAREPFALVISDIFMPDSDGLELLDHIRRLPMRPPVLAMSGSSTARIGGMLKVAVALGATRTLSKPFTPAEFLSTVGQLVGAEVRRGSPAARPSPTAP
ncbi:Alkaline phosphatase synthesis transcriptional regulatory protein PhoP [Lacunisphaera limnophila]|uniref:Alkaline phosphatase synthesis transcriptional regulatory protein PhoP n=2 Tax=Lacunisphaera limnophila TaxID=1838286 RepID=A0A1D8AR49_9BACT|nr:Alkaline phosphatase synthesis transcriptional regulatory protein PhoP [Lacunisphaera limnophila]